MKMSEILDFLIGRDYGTDNLFENEFTVSKTNRDTSLDWRDSIRMKYSFSDLLSVKEEAAFLLRRGCELLSLGLEDMPLPWDAQAGLSASEHKGRMDAIMTQLHLYADGTPMPLTWWHWLRHGTAIRRIEWKLAMIRRREWLVLESVRKAVSDEDKDAALVKHFILEQLPPFERYAVSIIIIFIPI